MDVWEERQDALEAVSGVDQPLLFNNVSNTLLHFSGNPSVDTFIRIVSSSTFLVCLQELRGLRVCRFHQLEGLSRQSASRQKDLFSKEVRSQMVSF